MSGLTVALALVLAFLVGVALTCAVVAVSAASSAVQANKRGHALKGPTE